MLCFGLIRPYKGVDVLLEAWRGIADAQLWIVGRPRMRHRGACEPRAGANVRWVTRYVSDGELAACFRRADIVVLPYREIEQSGVLATALAFGSPAGAQRRRRLRRGRRPRERRGSWRRE